MLQGEHEVFLGDLKGDLMEEASERTKRDLKREKQRESSRESKETNKKLVYYFIFRVFCTFLGLAQWKRMEKSISDTTLQETRLTLKESCNLLG